MGDPPSHGSSGHPYPSYSPPSPSSPFSPFSPALPQTPSSSSRADVAKARLERQIKRFRRDPESPSLLRLPPLSADDLERQQLNRERPLEEEEEDAKKDLSDGSRLDSLPEIPQFEPIVIDLSNDVDDASFECPASPRASFGPIMDDHSPVLDFSLANPMEYSSIDCPQLSSSSTQSLSSDRPFHTGEDFVSLTRGSSVSRLDPPAHLPSYRRRLRLVGSGHKDDGDMDDPENKSFFGTTATSDSTVTGDLADEPPSPFERRRKRWEHGRVPSISQVEGLYRPALERTQFGNVPAPKPKRNRSSRGRSRSLEATASNPSMTSGPSSSKTSFSVMYNSKPLPFLKHEPNLEPMTPVAPWTETSSSTRQKPQLLSRFVHKRKSSSISSLSDVMIPAIPALPTTYQGLEEPEISPGGQKSLVRSLIMRRSPSVSPTKPTFDSTTYPRPPGTFTSATLPLAKVGSALLKTVARAKQLDDPFTLGSLVPRLSANQASPFNSPRLATSNRKGKGRAQDVPPEADTPPGAVSTELRTPPPMHSSASWKGKGRYREVALDLSPAAGQRTTENPPVTSPVDRKGKGRARDTMSPDEELYPGARPTDADSPAVTSPVDRKGKGKAREVDMPEELPGIGGDPKFGNFTPPATSTSDRTGKGEARYLDKTALSPGESLEASVERLDQKRVQLAIEASLLDQEQFVHGEGTTGSAKHRQLEQRSAEIDEERRALGLITSPSSASVDQVWKGSSSPRTPVGPNRETLVYRQDDTADLRFRQIDAGALFQQRLGVTDNPSGSNVGRTPPANPYGAIGETGSVLIPSGADSEHSTTPEPRATTMDSAGPYWSSTYHLRSPSEIGSPEEPVLVSHFSDSSDDTIKAVSGCNSDSSSSSDEIGTDPESVDKITIPEALFRARPPGPPTRVSALPRTVGPSPPVVRRGLGLFFQAARPPPSDASTTSSADSSGHPNRLFRRDTPATRGSTPSLIVDDASEVLGPTSLARSLSNQESELWEEDQESVEVTHGLRAHPIDAHLEQDITHTLPPARERSVLDGRRTITPPPAAQPAEVGQATSGEYHFPMDIIHLGPSTRQQTASSSPGERALRDEPKAESAPRTSQRHDIPTIRFIDPTPTTSSISLLQSPLAVPSPNSDARPFVSTDYPPPFNIIPVPSPGLDRLRLANPAVEGGWRAIRRTSWASAEGSFDRAFTLLPSLMDDSHAGQSDLERKFQNQLRSHGEHQPLRNRSFFDVAALREVVPERIDADSRRGAQEWQKRMGSILDLARSIEDIRRKLGRSPVVSWDILFSIADRARERRQQISTSGPDDGNLSGEVSIEHRANEDEGIEAMSLTELARRNSEPLVFRSWQAPPSRAMRGQRLAPSITGLENLPDRSSPVRMIVMGPADGDIPRPETPDDNPMLSSKDAEYASGVDDEVDPSPRKGESEHDLARRMRRQYRRSNSEQPLTGEGESSDSDINTTIRNAKRHRRRRYRHKSRTLPRSMSVDEELGEADHSDLEGETAWRRLDVFTPTRRAPTPPVGELPATALWTEEEIARGFATRVSEYEAMQTGRVTMPFLDIGFFSLEEAPPTPSPAPLLRIPRLRGYQEDRTRIVDTLRTGFRPITDGAMGLSNALFGVIGRVLDHLNGRTREFSTTQ